MLNELFKTNRTSLQDGTLEGEKSRVCDKFHARFRRSLLGCAKRGFSVEECFGVVWEETLEEITLSEADQSRIYGELIDWARLSLSIEAALVPPLDIPINLAILATSCSAAMSSWAFALFTKPKVGRVLRGEPSRSK